MAVDDLKELLDVLTQHGVRHYEDAHVKIALWKSDMVECGACGERMLSKVLGGHRCDLAEAPAAALGAPRKDPDVCACGCSISTEHNESGCMRGHSHEVCMSTDGVPL